MGAIGIFDLCLILTNFNNRFLVFFYKHSMKILSKTQFIPYKLRPCYLKISEQPKLAMLWIVSDEKRVRVSIYVLKPIFHFKFFLCFFICLHCLHCGTKPAEFHTTTHHIQTSALNVLAFIFSFLYVSHFSCFVFYFIFIFCSFPFMLSCRLPYEFFFLIHIPYMC